LTKQRLDVRSAADALGISVDAVRMRARRGSLDSEHEDGRLYVWVDVDETPDETDVRDALIGELKDRIRYLEEESRRKDAILMTMAQRIPELEPASEPRESPTDGLRGLRW
jgi:hypothetical protein